MLSRLDRVLTRVIALLNRLQAPTLLLVRLAVGVVFVGTGWGKLHDLASVIDFFRELGIPAPELQAPMVAGIEFVGGILLLIGLGTRFAALPLSGTMVVAIATAKWKEVVGVTDVFSFNEFDYLVLFIVLVAFGGGALSVDGLLAWRKRKAAPVTPAVAPAAEAKALA